MNEKLTIKELAQENERVTKFKNIIAFLHVLFGEKDIIREVYEMSPDYIMEKYDQYVIASGQQFKWGMHPNLKNELFNEYLELWGLKYND